MLYDVLLHEIGHLQVFDATRRSQRLRFYHEKLAQEFAKHWRRQLWSTPFDHPDPVHNPPTEVEPLEPVFCAPASTRTRNKPSDRYEVQCENRR
jgi:hypothetical protein